MNEKEASCRIALASIRGLGLTRLKALIDVMGSAQAVIENARDIRSHVRGLPSELTSQLCNPNLTKVGEEEVEWAVKHNVDILIDSDIKYPSRLRECPDAPPLLFFKGNTDLNAIKVVSIVGTRHATAYGRSTCDTFVNELAALCPGTLVVSGLAYGIDIEAHRASLQAGLPTVAVLAHGFDRIYPPVHRQTAVEMLADGGLLTEYGIGTRPERQNFVCRNRIIAGLADATVVIESAAHGGALITASLANDYDRDCFAFPGRAGDEYSAGCNRFIADNRATLLLSAAEFVKKMMWDVDKTPGKNRHVQRQLFVELSPEEEKVVDILRNEGDLQLDALVLATSMPVNKLTTILFNLEMNGVVRILAGNVYQLI